MNTTQIKSYVVVETWQDLASAVENIIDYLDTVKAKGQKERLALDMETCIAYEFRYEYNLRHSLKACRKKELKAWASGIYYQLDAGVKSSTIDLSEAPEGFEFKLDAELPVPEPVKNKKGLYEARVRLIQIGLDPKNVDLQYNIDLYKIAKSGSSLDLDTAEDSEVLTFYRKIGLALKTILDRACIIGQYLPYEYSFLWHFFKAVPKLMRDVGLMSQILYMGDKINHKLSSLYRLYIPKEKFKVMIGYKPTVAYSYDIEGNETKTTVDEPFDYYDDFKKKEQKSAWYLPELEEIQHIYAAQDVGPAIWAVFEELLEQLTAWSELYGYGILDVVQMECELIRAIVKSKVVGFSLDVPYCNEVVVPYYRGLMDEAQAEIDKMYQRTIVTDKKRTIGRGKDKVIEHYKETTTESYNLGSHQQIRVLTGLSKSVLETTGYKDLLFFKDKHPAVKWLIQYKKAQKALGYFTSGESGYLTLVDGEDKIHHTTHQIGKDEYTIDTGRMAGSTPNLMQTPSDSIVRKAFIAPKKRREVWKLVIKDFSQIEPRIIAEITKDSFLWDCFSCGRDLHAETAKTVFKLDELPTDDGPNAHWRKKGKTIRLARTYMMGVVKGMKDVYVKSDTELDYVLRGKEGEDEFRQILEDFDNLTPDVKRKQEEIAQDVKALAYTYGGMWEFRTGRPFYVAKSMMGRTRRFCLSPEERSWCTQNPEKWKTNLRVLYEKTGNISTWANNANSALRDAAKNAFNNLGQSSGADICKLSIVNINKRLEEQVELGVLLDDECLINFVHDELIAQCRESSVSIVEQIMEEEMTKAAQRFIKTIPTPVEGSSGDNWYAAKKKKVVA